MTPNNDQKTIDAVLALDLGSTNVKAALVTVDGRFLSANQEVAEVAQKVIPGSNDQDPNDLWAGVMSAGRTAIRNGLGTNRETDIRIVNVVASTYQYGLIVLDSAGNPAPEAQMTTLQNTRGSMEDFEHFRGEWHRFRASGLGKSLYEITRCPCWPIATLPRLWFFKERGANEERAWFDSEDLRFASAKAWIFEKFTGEFVTEPSTESSSQLIDIQDRDWSQPVLKKLGLNSSQFPRIEQDFLYSSSIRAKVKDELLSGLGSGVGFEEGCKMVIGVYDGGALALGSNCFRPGSPGLSNVGTTGMVRVSVQELPDPEPEGEQVLQPQCFIDGTFLHGGAVNNAGNVLDWFQKIMGLGDGFWEDEDFSKSSEVVFLPFLTPERDERIGANVEAMFRNTNGETTLSDLIRAVVEAVVFNLARLRDAIGDSLPSSIRVGGGVYKSPAFRKLVAQVLNRELQISGLAEPALVGNAMLGFTSAKYFENLSQAAAAMTSTDPLETVYPIMGNRHRRWIEGAWGYVRN